jgi:hypothetical protein
LDFESGVIKSCSNGTLFAAGNHDRHGRCFELNYFLSDASVIRQYERPKVKQIYTFLRSLNRVEVKVPGFWLGTEGGSRRRDGR